VRTTDNIRYSLLGLPFHAVSLEQAALQIEDAIKNQQKCFVSTPNLNFVMMAKQDELFYQSVIKSDLIVADGMPIVWAAKLLNIPISERVAGSDVFQFLYAREASPKIRVFFFGGEKGIAQQAHEVMNAQSHGMESCGYHDPGFVPVGQMSSDDIINKINLAKPDFIVVALGARKGQHWIMHNQSKLNAPVISHLGAVINFVAGHVQRAPTSWQRIGLEWVWRIKQEPKLFQRYAQDGFGLVAQFFLNILPLMVYQRYLAMTSKNKPSAIEVEQNNGHFHLLLKGHLNLAYLDQFDGIIAEILGATHEVIIDMQQLFFVDSAVIARLQHVQSELALQQKSLKLKNVPRSIRIFLRLSGVMHRFQLI